MENLLQFNNIQKDLLFWIEQYIGSKIYKLSIKPEKKEDFIKDVYFREIINSKDIGELQAVILKIRRQGMPNLGTYFNPLYSFYINAINDKNIKTIKEIDSNFIDIYISKNPSKLKPKSIIVHLTVIGSFFKYIEKNNIDDTTSGEPYFFNLKGTMNNIRSTI